MQNLLLIIAILMSQWYFKASFAAVATRSLSFTHKASLHMPKENWVPRIIEHPSIIETLIYPPGNTVKSRRHSVSNHPIYNFLHRYYSYSVEDLMKYSPGMDVLLNHMSEECLEDWSGKIHDKFMKFTNDGAVITPNHDLIRKSEGRFSWIGLTKNRDILRATVSKNPFFGCFGLHEWAMLYSGNKNNSIESTNSMKRHQSLPLRISQEVIDKVVESGNLKCTHFDAFRFFHPDAKNYNAINPLTRIQQIDFEQPGCVHVDMDIFKYAYQIYPLISSEILVDSLRIAIKSRIIDMRASPYDLSQFPECQGALAVETKEGRMNYAFEQEQLYHEGKVVREKVLNVYEKILNSYLQDGPSSEILSNET